MLISAFKNPGLLGQPVAHLVRVRALNNKVAGSIPTRVSELRPPQLH